MVAINGVYTPVFSQFIIIIIIIEGLEQHLRATLIARSGVSQVDAVLDNTFQWEPTPKGPVCAPNQ